jgi:GTP pyrophosphokinase
VEVLTSANQTPKQDWLSFVVTSKARNKIRQTLKEIAQREAEFGKENWQRRLKNRKIEYDESVLMKVIKKLKYKTVTDFFAAIGTERLDINDAIEWYVKIAQEDKLQPEIPETRSAEEFVVEPREPLSKGQEDVLLIDQQLTGIDYKLAHCCNPIYGDDVFGFVSSQGGIKIHRKDCPNAAQMMQRFGYRIVKYKWAGKGDGSHYPVTLQVVGNDDIAIVTNISSVLSKEPDVTLRSISIDSNDGLFSGQLTVMVSDVSQLKSIIKKIKNIKGVKQVERSV